MPIHVHESYFTPCPVPSFPAYEPNSNDCEYLIAIPHIQYKRTPSFRPSLPWQCSCADASPGACTDVATPDLASCCRLGGLHQQEAQQGVACLADVPQPLLAALESSLGIIPTYVPILLAAVEPLRSFR